MGECPDSRPYCNALFYHGTCLIGGPCCNTLGPVDHNKTIGSRKGCMGACECCLFYKVYCSYVYAKWCCINLDMLVRRVSKRVYRRGLPIPTQNNYLPLKNFYLFTCHVHIRYSIPCGNHIPSHVKM